MIDFPKAHYGISYVEMIVDQSGLYHQSEPVAFDGDDPTAAVCYSAAAAIASWTHWMSSQDLEVTEIPSTERTRGWGRVFSAILKDGTESRLYAVNVGAY